MRELIVGMNLNRKRLACKQQLEQERRIDRRVVGSLVADFTDWLIVRKRVAPRTQIIDAPEFWYGLRARMFNRHNLPDVRPRQRMSTEDVHRQIANAGNAKRAA